MVPKPGPGELHPPCLSFSLPPYCFCCCSSNPSCESLALSINSLLSCFTIHLIHQQAAGPEAYGIETACLGRGCLKLGVGPTLFRFFHFVFTYTLIQDENNVLGGVLQINVV